jgi:hypothetical protein
MKKLITTLSAIAFAAVVTGCEGGTTPEPPPDNDDGPAPTEAGGE